MNRVSIAITQTLGLGQTPSPGVPGVLTSLDHNNNVASLPPTSSSEHELVNCVLGAKM